MVQINIPDPTVPYVILIINCIVFRSARQVFLPLFPSQLRLLVSEFISTVELCSDCAELGVVWEIHGNVAYAVALLLKCLWWSKVFDDAEACPCGPVEQCALLGTPMRDIEVVQRFAGQILGAVATAYYTNGIWCWHLTREHTALHTKRCQATLAVPYIYGAMIEGLITFISRFVALESGSWGERTAIWINSILTTLLVLAALDTTGGYFNPIMASALTFNCKGNTLYEHIIVYWIGSLVGGILARLLHIFIRGPPKKSKLL